ncbi:MAG: exonuclease domain-containing protein [Gammaproteobacteria bacterium]
MPYPNNTYLFYDIETSGLSKCFDQVVQFASIRTDLEFRELEHHNIFVKLNTDAVPSPQAFLTHQISLKKLQEEGIPEFEAIKQIHQLLNKPGTLSLGYNTLGFDDEFLRFSFYRNLLPPYTHQYANGCGRIDLYPITVLYYLFKNEILNWPEVDGKSTLKLEHLSSANNLHSGTSHDAMSDVEATLAMARIFSRERAMWDYAKDFFQKRIDETRIDALEPAWPETKHPIACMFDGIFGANNLYHSPVLGLGRHNHYKNQYLWLRLDDEKLLNLRSENIVENFSLIYRKKLGEGGLVLPFSERHTRHLSVDRKKRMEENILWLSKNAALLAELSNYYREYKYPLVPNIDVDADLYQQTLRNVFTSQQNMLEYKFQTADFSGKLRFVKDCNIPGLREAALRLLGRNYLSDLPGTLATEFNGYLKRALTLDENLALIDYKGGRRLTIPAMKREMLEIEKKDNLTTSQREILADLCHFHQKIS